jgi:hypothetical protein
MLIQQMRPRVLFLDHGGDLRFPNNAHLQIEFAPNPGLGGPAPPGQTTAAGVSARLEWNANLGRSTVSPEVPLPETNRPALRQHR